MFNKFIMDFKLDLLNLVDSKVQDFRKQGFEFYNYDEWKAKQKNGRDTSKNEFLRNQLFTYSHLQLRLIPAMRRNVKTANGFEVSSGYDEGFRMFCEESEHGVNLLPRMSRQVWNSNKTDIMLCDLNIHHFHLGTRPDEHHPNMIEGLEKILYAIVHNDVIYALRIDIHGHWNDTSLLELAYDSFPELKEYFDMFKMSINNLAGEAPDDDTRKELLSHGINTPIKIHNDHFISLGWGMSGAITSMQSVIIADGWIHQVLRFEKEIDIYVEEKKTMFQSKFSQDEEIHLIYFNESVAIFHLTNQPYEIIFLYSKYSPTIQRLLFSPKMSVKDSFIMLSNLLRQGEEM